MTDQETIASRLAEIVGATHVSSAPTDVDAYGGLDPSLVVWPGAASEVARVLRSCTEMGVAVGVSAGGTRAMRHWPVHGDRPRIALDTRRMLNILEVDELSLTVHSQCGIELGHLEQALNRHGLTLGPYPPLIQRHTLGGVLAAPHPRAHSPRTGWLIDACLGVSVANADGTVLHTRIAPRKATGPDTARLYIGSRGALGVVTTAVLRVYRQSEHEVVLAFVLPDLMHAVDAAHDLLEHGVRPARLRALGAEQAVEELGQTHPPSPAVLLVVLAGPATLVAAEQRLLEQVLHECGGRELPHAVGGRWWARNAALTSPPELGPSVVGVRVRYSAAPLAVASVPQQVQQQQVLVWAEEFTLQGFTLWSSLGGTERREATVAPLRSALLDCGLDPIQLDFPPLMDELRQQLDPAQTLVVMEA